MLSTENNGSDTSIEHIEDSKIDKPFKLNQVLQLKFCPKVSVATPLECGIDVESSCICEGVRS